MTAIRFKAAWILCLCLLIYAQAQFLEYYYPERIYNPDCPWCESATQEDIVFIPVNASALRLISPADTEFLADVLWLRTIYYFGQHVLSDRKYTYFLHLLDLISDLAPRWEQPYLYGGVLLPTEADNVEDGLYIIEKGLIYHPDNWELFFLKGYYQWKHFNDEIAAAEAFHKASLCPKAPIYLATLAATFTSKHGERSLSKFYLEQVLVNVQNPEQRQLIMNKLKEIEQNESGSHTLE